MLLDHHLRSVEMAYSGEKIAPPRGRSAISPASKDFWIFHLPLAEHRMPVFDLEDIDTPSKFLLSHRRSKCLLEGHSIHLKKMQCYCRSIIRGPGGRHTAKKIRASQRAERCLSGYQECCSLTRDFDDPCFRDCLSSMSNVPEVFCN